MRAHAPARRPSAVPESFHPSPQRAEVRRIHDGHFEIQVPDGFQPRAF